MLTSGSPGEPLPACLPLRNKVFLCGFRTTAWIFGFEFRSLPLRGVGEVAEAATTWVIRAGLPLP